jgi:hypothetical protein
MCKGVNINIKGILHIGAHECDELKDYNNAGIDIITYTGLKLCKIKLI